MPKENKTDPQLDIIKAQLDELTTLLNKSADKPPSFTENTKQIASTISAITAALAGTTFAVYIIGSVIVNDYLRAFGVREFELTKPNYFMAGAAFLIFILISMVLPALLMSLTIEKAQSKNREKPVQKKVIYPLLALLFSSLGIIVSLISIIVLTRTEISRITITNASVVLTRTESFNTAEVSLDF